VGLARLCFPGAKASAFASEIRKKNYREQCRKYIFRKNAVLFPGIEQAEIFPRANRHTPVIEMGPWRDANIASINPLGGYVKMMGQDDLKPDAVAEDPGAAYNKKSIPARMLVISAGVIMNVILAAHRFIDSLQHGIQPSTAYVGNILSNVAAAESRSIRSVTRFSSSTAKPRKISQDHAEYGPGLKSRPRFRWPRE